MKVVKKHYPDGHKCGGCNWRVENLYAVETLKDKIDEYGLCGDCFCEMLVEEGFDIDTYNCEMRFKYKKLED